jgi:uncharacterized protein YndB with AHSA1/START domain
MSILSRIFGLFRKGSASASALGAPPSTSRNQMTMTRVYDVGRHRVWQMWTKPELLAEWWGVPPLAATKDTILIDLKVGGKWQADMVNQNDGTVVPFRGAYVEVDPPRKLVFTIENPADPESPDVETVTVIFTDNAGTTRMTMQQVGHLPEEQYGAPLENGYSAFFDRMAKYLRLHQD